MSEAKKNFSWTKLVLVMLGTTLVAGLAQMRAWRLHEARERDQIKAAVKAEIDQMERDGLIKLAPGGKQKTGD